MFDDDFGIELEIPLVIACDFDVAAGCPSQ